MSSDIIISVEGLGKRYRLGAKSGERYTALRDVVAEAAAKPFRSLSGRFKSKVQENGSADFNLNSATSTASQGGPSTSTQTLNSARSEEFWALRDINFEVRRGEVLGIIGRNGAGKSTLLKILSRITEPTEGRIRIKGRVASLLEVGTGFHPELTGRENIFLNGAVLGMHRHEIKAKFDEIVAFAEVEKFLDTPVKRYSSGMYVRLAFAVAAHLEPEILIVDEVLAVGDAEFQKKCLGKMQQVAKGQGRTVLFVSHNMGAVQSLCERGMLLSAGNAACEGPVEDAIAAYLSNGHSSRQFERFPETDKELQVFRAKLDVEATGRECVTLELHARTRFAISVAVDIRLSDTLGIPVAFGSLGTLDRGQQIALLAGDNTVRIVFPTTALANGSYQISIDVTIPFHRYLERLEQCLRFDIERAPRSGLFTTVLQSWGYGSMELPLALDSGNS